MSPQESRLIDDLRNRRQGWTTPQDVTRILGTTPGNARLLVHRLARRGWLERQRRGRYLFRDGGVEAPARKISWYLRGDEYVSFRTACALHGLCEPDADVVCIASPSRRSTIHAGGRRYTFVRVGSLEGAARQGSLEGEDVRVATMERAVADALRHPRHAGGILVLAEILRRASERMSWDVILDFVERFGESAVAQRLGYLVSALELAVPTSLQSDLRALVRPRIKVHLGPRGSHGTRGPLDAAWNVVVNVPALARSRGSPSNMDVVLL